MGRLSKVKGPKRMEDMPPEMKRNLEKAFENSARTAERFKKKRRWEVERLLKDKTEY